MKDAKKKYLECWRYLKECRKQIFAAGIMLLTFVLIGYFYPVFFVEEIKEFIKELLLKTAGLNAFQMILFIFSNNLVVSFIGMSSGILFGIIPAVLAAANGYILGFVSQAAAGESGVLVLLKLLPHGIFEIPAVLISLGLGIKLGGSLFYKYRESVKILKKSLLVFLFVIIPLLIIAGIIEGLLIIFFS